MDKDNLKELEDVYWEMTRLHEQSGEMLVRLSNLLEKEIERERLLGVTREVESFENQT